MIKLPDALDECPEARFEVYAHRKSFREIGIVVRRRDVLEAVEDETVFVV